jgi:hypothetical protein
VGDIGPSRIQISDPPDGWDAKVLILEFQTGTGERDMNGFIRGVNSIRVDVLEGQGIAPIFVWI